MKLIHHVKKHGKTITLHLKKHHKKYIFGILSATLVWKGVSLIAAYALVHNLSFSFADIVHNEGGDEQVIETEITEEETLVEEETNENDENDEDNENENDLDEQEQTEQDTSTTEEGINETEFVENNEENLNNETDNLEITNDDNLSTNDDEDDLHEQENNKEDIDNEGNTDNGNGICDEGDIIITNPKEGDIVGKNFDITREYTNNDCTNNYYTIKLRDQNDQYINIFSGHTPTTGYNFDSTQLITQFYTITGTNESGEIIVLHEGAYTGNATDYFSGHKLAIVSNEKETIYRIQEGGEFTIDNKKPEISNVTVEYSTTNNKLNIGDTITISFESDEELKDTTVNILGQYAVLEEKSGNIYKYSMDFSEKNTLGKVVYGIEYQDSIGNTGYLEGYENRELDYTQPAISDLMFTLISNQKVKITFNTNKKTDINLIYQISGTKNTTSINYTGMDQFRIILDDIKETDEYNYSISIQDEAKNNQFIGGNFYISGNDIIFTNKEIKKSELLTDYGFTGNQKDTELKLFTNYFGICANEIDTKPLKLAINKQRNIIINIPKFSDDKTNKMSNAFVAALYERVENKKLPQYAIDEITEDVNNFLMIVKLVKDDNNACKQNMTQYYINKLKKSIIKYGLVND